MSRDPIDRRTFLERTAALSAAAALGPAVAARAAEAPPAARRPAPFELEELSIADLQAGMRSGKWTSKSITEAYLARIEAMNTQGPALRAVIEVNPDAAAIAAALDAERKTKGPRGPLHGVPVLVKDNVATRDRMNTTAGSLALVGVQPPRDAFLAARLRAAGAVILGKANLSEWANFRSTHSSSGWSGRGGQCRNPNVLDRTPSGSSSGSAAAVAASLCPVAIGTETNGSIVSPSSCCGIVGIKPTLGLVSRAGVIPISHNQDTAGPMARTVTDAAILLSAITGVDPRDPATAAGAGKAADYTKALSPGALKGARIGVARKRFFGPSPKADALINAALDVLRGLGAVIVDPADFDPPGSSRDSEFTVLLYDFKADLNAYLADLGPASPMKSLADLIAFDTAHADQEMPYFGQEIFLQAQEKGPLTDKAYQDALAADGKYARTDGLDATFAKYQVDAIVAPTNGPPSPIDLVNGEGDSGSFSGPAAIAGYPHVTVPAGYTFGLPVGLSFVGAPWTEAKLIGYAYAYEQATKLRKPPQYLPTVQY